jgi:hypothetical protein
MLENARRPGEVDPGELWTRQERVAEFAGAPGQEVHDARREAGLHQDLKDVVGAVDSR